MKRAVKAVVILAVLIAAFFLLRTKVLWLDSFDGTIVKKEEKALPTVVDRHAQEISSYYFDIETDDGAREIRVKVDQLQYFRAREGMRVSKQPFSSKVELAE